MCPSRVYINGKRVLRICDRCQLFADILLLICIPVGTSRENVSDTLWRISSRVFKLLPHPELHPVFEVLGYVLGFAAYRRAALASGDPLKIEQRWNVIAAAVLGAVAGSRLLG